MARGGKRPGAGRPQGALNRATESQRATLSELARDHTEEAVAALLDVMRHGASESARIAAANAVLDRGYGKAAVSLDVDNTSSDGTMTPKVRELTSEEIDARMKHLQAVIDAGEADCKGALVHSASLASPPRVVVCDPKHSMNR